MMNDDFYLDAKQNESDFPEFIDGKRISIDERGERYMIVDGRKWVLDPNEAPLETPDDPELFRHFPPPPRQITLLGRLTLLFGAGLPGLLIFGCIFACFGMIFVCLFVGAGAVDTYAAWRENGNANITSIEDCHFSVNNAKVYAYSFSGQDADGNTVSGVSYAFENKFEKDQTVPLQRAQFFGEKWKLKDASFSAGGDTFGYFVLFTLIFPIVGACMIFFGVILPGLKRGPLLIYGELALASFLRQESTGTRVNQQPVQKLVFEFETPDGEQYEAAIKTLTPDKFLRGGRRKGGQRKGSQRKIIFYNPGNPEKNLIWDDVASMMKFDEFRQCFTGFTVNLLIFPVFLAIFCFELVWFFNNVATGKMFF